MAEAIILRGGTGGVDCESATARANHVLAGYTFGTSTSDDLVTGTMANHGAVSSTLVNPTGAVYTIPQGYHNGNGTVRGQAVTSVSAYTITPSANAQTISAGQWYTGDVTIKADSNFVASNIRQNVNIYGTVGTCPDYASAQTAWTR